MNAIHPRRLPAIACCVAIALAGCGERSPQGDVAATPPPAPEPASPPAHDLRPAADAIEATAESVDAATGQLAEGARSARERWHGRPFEEFLATVYKEPGEDGKYIVDGDIAIPDVKLLEEFFQRLQNGEEEDPGRLDSALAVNTVNGGVDAWTSERKRRLSYCVSDAFGARKAAATAAMADAGEAWEKAANVDFVHLAEHDGDCTAANAGVLFDVRPVDVGGAYLARAFFPSDQRRDRNVLVDDSSFGLAPGGALQLVGILRHELGHVLGWRHEHTRPESGTCFEDGNFRPLTSYDAFSVMHYPQCNGGGDWSLALTALDSAGAACIYGRGSDNDEDLAQCRYRAPEAPATGGVRTQVFEDQSVARGELRRYDPFEVKPGSIARVSMTGTGASPGDPDLYVRFFGQPSPTAWNCRPYLSGANETCELEVPRNRDKVHVMVRGYRDGQYRLEVAHTAPD